MNMHYSEGELRSYLDGELPELASSRVNAHLAECPRCQAYADRLFQRARSVARNVDRLSPESGVVRSAAAGRRHLERYISENKESTSMWNQIFSRRTRPALVLASLVLIFLLALTIPSVRAAAINFLGLFRVQQIAVVEVNPANLPEQLGSSMSFEQLLAEDIQFGDPGESETVSSAAEASALAGFQVRLPKAAQGEVQLRVQPGTQVTYNTEIERIQQILKEIGRSDIQLPDDLDNAAIVLDVPTSVLAGYGNCKLDHQEGEQGRMSSDPQSNCTILIQMPSPTISAPPGLDIPQIGEAFLQVMGMSAAEAERFSSRVDWATTLVIPVPRNGVDYADVQVDGVTGTLITQSRDVRAPNYMLLWVKGGQLYVLTGAGRPESGVEIADSLE